MIDLLQDLRIHPLRTVLTGVSLFIGVLAVVGIVLAGSVARSVAVATAEQQSGRSPSYLTSIEFGKELTGQRLIELAHSLPTTTRVSMEYTGLEGIAVSPWPGDGGVPVTVTRSAVSIVAGDMLGTLRMPITSGRWLSADEQTAPIEVVVNKASARTIGGQGRVVAISGTGSTRVSPGVVVGIVNDGDSEPRIYVKATALAHLAPTIARPSGIVLRWHVPGWTSSQVASASSDWAADMRLPPPDSPVRVDTVDEFLPVISTLQVSFGAAAVLALAVAAIGILNVGLASISERSRELVIRRALGASRASIFALVVGSSMLLAVAVAIISVVVAAAVVAAFPMFLPPDTPIDSPVFPVMAVVVGTSAALLTALLGALAPGLAASRSQPGNALRT
ncbi:MAG: ABC transporter permease [Actinobacteria bacterium]|nr:ABC transporter permease [Actinomycetota bacterium]MBU4207154.1 ABC transporter permease [Actinomycetota bacterium]